MKDADVAKAVKIYINHVGAFIANGSAPNLLNQQYLGLLYKTFSRARSEGDVPGWDAVAECLREQGVHPETMDQVAMAWTLWRFGWKEDKGIDR